MSAFKVQEAFVYPIMNPKLGTSLIMTELYITWLAPMKGFSSTVTYNLENNYYFVFIVIVEFQTKLTLIVLNGKFCPKVKPVAEIMKSASTWVPSFIWTPFFVKWSMWSVTMLAFLVRKGSKKSPPGARQNLWSQGLRNKKLKSITRSKIHFKISFTYL